MKSSLPGRIGSPNSAHERGVALIISLILLTLMSLVGMAGIRAINKEERMVAQSFDRSLSFHAAESALREAEGWIEQAGRPTPAVDAACTLMGTAPQVKTCGALLTPTVPRWLDSSFSNWSDASEVGTGTFKVTPQYFVEYLGGDFPCTLTTVAASTCKRYRITARANPGDGRSAVMLQSIYATFEP
jgi:type IV pilus assembly protein PilX